MRIKLALLDKDQNYLNRIVSVFNTKYSDKLEIYSFTNTENALATLDSARIDVLVASDVFEIDADSLPSRCGFAYFVDSPDISTLNNQHAICKFQKADLIYKQILSVYSENAESVSGLKIGDDSCKVIAFTSPSGGTGSSSMAAACAIHYATQGKKTLYLNFEKFGSSDSFFSAEGQFDMSDIIFALKSKKTNLSMKLESCVKQDLRGVYFYSQPKIALDMFELEADEILHLISEARISGSYSFNILDIDFGIDKKMMKILRQANSIVWTGDGSEISNLKIHRAYNAFLTLEQTAESSLLNRVVLIYNKFSNKISTVVNDIDLHNVGGAPRYEHTNTSQVLERLSSMEIFDKID